MVSAEDKHWEKNYRKMHLGPKVNRTQVSPAERKHDHVHARKRSVHVQRVSCSLEETWVREFVWSSAISFNKEYFDQKIRRGFTENKYRHPLCVCSSAVYDPRYFTQPYIFSNKRQKKSRLCFYTKSLVGFFFYTTVPSSLLSLGAVCLQLYIYIYMYIYPLYLSPSECAYFGAADFLVRII